MEISVKYDMKLHRYNEVQLHFMFLKGIITKAEYNDELESREV